MSLGPLPALPNKVCLTTCTERDEPSKDETRQDHSPLDSNHVKQKPVKEPDPNHPTRNYVEDADKEIRSSRKDVLTKNGLSKGEPCPESHDFQSPEPGESVSPKERENYITIHKTVDSGSKNESEQLKKDTPKGKFNNKHIANDTRQTTSVVIIDENNELADQPSILAKNAIKVIERSESLPEDVSHSKTGRKVRQQWANRQLSTPDSRADFAASLRHVSSKYWRGHVTVAPAYEMDDIIVPVPKKPPPFPMVDEDVARLPITRAIRKGDHKLVLECLRQGEESSVVCPTTGQTFLHMAVWSANIDQELRWVPIVYQLSNAGVDIDQKENDGISPVLVAIRRKLLFMLSAILKCGAELGLQELHEVENVRGVVRADMLETVRRFNPTYWVAVLDPTSFKVRRLVKAWARINVTRRGQTLLEFTKQHATNPDVVRILSQHEASVELAHAVMAGDKHRTNVLMCDGATNLDSCDFSVRSISQGALLPLSLVDWAEKLGHTEMVKILLAKGCGRGVLSSVGRKDSQAGLHQVESEKSMSYGEGYQNGSTTSALCNIL